jgi:hypothetical protein
MTKRVSFLVDGFNVYHSLSDLQGLTGASVKWLDLRSLCNAYLHSVRGAIGEKVDIAEIHYFSARPDFLIPRKPDTLVRYDAYMTALRHSGVRVNLSQFKRKSVTCPHCKKEFERHEEKETDVAIAIKIIDIFVRNEADTVVLVTGDTDLIPAIRMINGLLPRSKIGVAFPFRRHNNELEEVANYSFKIQQKDLQKYQFPAVIKMPDGTGVQKPRSW